MSNLTDMIVRSFAGGELAPSLAARADLAKYAIGLRECRNFVVQRHGGVANRAGFRFVNECRDNTGNVHLLRYVSETNGESVLIEAGLGYLRFYQNGGLVTVDQSGLSAWNSGTDYEPGDLATRLGVAYYCKAAHTNQQPPNATYWHPLAGDIYEVPTPFTGAAYRFKWTQSGRVITFTHPLLPPHDLVFQAITRWALVPLNTAPKVTPPQNVILTVPAGARRFAYRVTAAAPDSYEESEPSAIVVNVAAAEPTEAAPHVITWDPVLVPLVTGDPAPEYYIYCDPHGNNTFGFVGTATGATTFRNPGTPPDFSITPPLPRILFTQSDGFPSACGYHQQRRILANTNDTPDAVYGSRVGFPDNYGIASPLQDDDAITFRLAGNNNHAVHWVVGLKQLILLTGGGEWAVGRPLEPLTPSDIPADQETYVGISDTVRPVVIGNSIVYVQARGSIFRDLQFDQQVEGLAGRDLTVFASHLFDGRTILDADYAQTPHSIVWAVRNDGTLLGLTYNREQDIMAWHRHDTQLGGFERVCVVPEAGEDAVYVVTGRTKSDGSIVRWIEKLERREILSLATDGFFVDAGLSYSGPPVASVSGLDHLEGEVVAVVADGVVLYDGDPDGDDAGSWVVSGGAIALGQSASNIHVGLRYVPQITTLDLDASGTELRAKKKRIAALSVILNQSSRSFYAGNTAATLRRYTPAAVDPTEALYSGLVELSTKSKWEIEGRVIIRQTDPLPIEILGVIPHTEVEGA